MWWRPLYPSQVGHFGGVPFYLCEYIPFRQTEWRDTDEYESYGIERDILCVQYDGAILIHPDRWEYFKEMME